MRTHSKAALAIFVVTAAVALNATGLRANWAGNFGGGPLGQPGTTATIEDILKDGDDIYVCGSFTTIGGVTADRVAKWNGLTWVALPGVAGTPYALAKLGSDIVVAGSWLNPNYDTILRWDGADWYPLGSGVDATVNALLTVGTDLYAGGYFLNAGGVPVLYVARWNGTSWVAIGAGLTDVVRAMAEWNGDVYAATNGGVNRWDGVAWSGLPSLSRVTGMTSDASKLYVSRIVTSYPQPRTSAVFAWDGTSWSASLGSRSFSGTVNTIEVDGPSLYAGGTMQKNSMGLLQFDRIAKWNGSAWTEMDGGITGDEVNALAAEGGKCWVGGRFSEAGGLDTGGITSFKRTGWDTHSVNGQVLAVASIGGDTYVGGDFVLADDDQVNRIARWDGSQWHSLSGGVNGIVRAMVAVGTDLYVAGDFTIAGITTLNHIGKWDGSTWSALGDGFATPGPAYALATDGTNVYAGGDFLMAGQTPVFNIARWDGATWSAFANGTDGVVRSIVPLAGELYVGGDFTKAGGQFAFHIS